MLIAILNITALSLVLTGALNWGLVGFFNFNLVSAIFGAGSALGVIIYSLIFISAFWLTFMAIYQRNKIVLSPRENEKLMQSDYKASPATTK